MNPKPDGLIVATNAFRELTMASQVLHALLHACVRCDESSRGSASPSCAMTPWLGRNRLRRTSQAFAFDAHSRVLEPHPLAALCATSWTYAIDRHPL